MTSQNTLQKNPLDDKPFFFLVPEFEENPKDVQLAYQVFIKAYYQDKSYGEKAIDAIQKYSTKSDFPLFNSMMTQAHFYLRPAPGGRTKLNLNLNKVGDYVDKRWRALNPFIVPSIPEDPQSVYVGIRMTNFDKEGTRYFAAHGGKIKNYYEGQKIHLSSKRVNWNYKFRDLTDYPRYTNDWYGVEGLEDFRVAVFYNEQTNTYRYVAIVVSIDAHSQGFPEIQVPRQSLVDMEFKDGYLEVKKLRPLVGSCVNNLNAQKNWLPFFDKEGQLYAIYSTPDFCVVRIHEPDGCCEEVIVDEDIKRKNEEMGTINFRGSSPPVPYGKNHLYSVHIVGFLPEGKGRVYYHRLVEISLENFEIKRISRMFYLNEAHTVEYISGAHNDGKSIHFTYGFDDKEAWIASLKHDEVEGMFTSCQRN